MQGSYLESVLLKASQVVIDAISTSTNCDNAPDVHSVQSFVFKTHGIIPLELQELVCCTMSCMLKSSYS